MHKGCMCLFFSLQGEANRFPTESTVASGSDRDLCGSVWESDDASVGVLTIRTPTEIGGWRTETTAIFLFWLFHLITLFHFSCFEFFFFAEFHLSHCSNQTWRRAPCLPHKNVFHVQVKVKKIPTVWDVMFFSSALLLPRVFLSRGHVTADPGRQPVQQCNCTDDNAQEHAQTIYTCICANVSLHTWEWACFSCTWSTTHTQTRSFVGISADETMCKRKDNTLRVHSQRGVLHKPAHSLRPSQALLFH